MSEILTFKKIKDEDIFSSEYNNLEITGNESIEFKMNRENRGGIAVLYAPNGTGKSSLCDVLSIEKESKNKYFEADYNGKAIKPEDKKFHVIKDQINRNVIPGDTADYLIGANIRREYDLKKRISEGFNSAFAQLAKTLKSDYKITKRTDFLLTKLTNEQALKYIKEIIPARVRGKTINRDEFIEYISNTQLRKIPDNIDENKVQYIINDSANAKLVEKLLSISLVGIPQNEEVKIMEQNDDAIKILKKYIDMDTCLVCDSREFVAATLLEKKERNRKRIYECLDSKIKDLFDNILKHTSIESNDPFNIKERIMIFITEGDINVINELKGELNQYISYISIRICNTLLKCFNGTNMVQDYSEYKSILETQPQITSEELLFIQEVISENIGPQITIRRDENNDRNFKLLLEDKEFIGVDRSKLHLSTGEQNFISLSFELLLARRSESEFIILDDPISSFDSLYKNKIAFCIIKFLENKKQIILTHNTDLIRLLDVQQNNCFNLYLFNNIQDGKNGFIKVNNFEKDILINLHKLIKLFQNNDNKLTAHIINEKLYLMAMIPFMRGYAHIFKDGDAIYSSLSGIMHGYEDSSVNITNVYEELFGYRFSHEYIITVDDILNINCDNIKIMSEAQYPLLADTLRQTLIYYYLRMKVEKTLVLLFNINIRPKHPLMLNQIIQKAFRYNDGDSDADLKRRYKVFFTSRKTLLNEFNHFEGNMNIFQPAIDISANALDKEVNSIEDKLMQIKSDFRIDM